MAELPTRKFECKACKHADFRMSTAEVGEHIMHSCRKCGGTMKVTGDKPPEWLSKAQGIVTSRFDVDDFLADASRMEFEISSNDTKKSFGEVFRELRKNGYLSAMRRTMNGLKVFVVKTAPVKPSNVWINVVLFVTTVFSTFLAGYFVMFRGSVVFSFVFSVAMMLMLGTHEIGHKISAWRNGIDATPPYFIPSPFGLGTFGAVINIKSPPPSKDSLVEMGLAGPLAGFAVALPLAFIGLIVSSPDPNGFKLSTAPLAFFLFQGGAVSNFATGIALNPLALAGWVALLITLLNLVPAGQLDGGHVARVFLGRDRHYFLTKMLGTGLFATGIFFPALPFWFWGLLIYFFFRNYHAGSLDDVSGLSRSSKILVVIAAVVFILCLPIPVM